MGVPCAGDIDDIQDVCDRHRSFEALRFPRVEDAQANGSEADVRVNDEQMSVTLRRAARGYRSYGGVKPIDNSALAE